MCKPTVRGRGVGLYRYASASTVQRRSLLKCMGPSLMHHGQRRPLVARMNARGCHCERYLWNYERLTKACAGVWKARTS